jgi:hypothetical protein
MATKKTASSWSRQAPDEPGFYLRSSGPGATPELARFEETETGVTLVRLGTTVARTASSDIGGAFFWMGPIPDPQD